MINLSTTTVYLLYTCTICLNLYWPRGDSSRNRQKLCTSLWHKEGLIWQIISTFSMNWHIICPHTNRAIHNHVFHFNWIYLAFLRMFLIILHPLTSYAKFFHLSNVPDVSRLFCQYACICPQRPFSESVSLTMEIIIM